MVSTTKVMDTIGKEKGKDGGRMFFSGNDNVKEDNTVASPRLFIFYYHPPGKVQPSMIAGFVAFHHRCILKAACYHL